MYGLDKTYARAKGRTLVVGDAFNVPQEVIGKYMQ